MCSIASLNPRGALLYAVGLLGTLIACASNVAAQPFDRYYASDPRAQYYPPNYYLPAPGYAPPPGYVPPHYDALPGLRPPPPYQRMPGGERYVVPAYGYAPPPAAEYAPPAPVLIPLRPRSCGKYRYWNGDYCADARYERPNLGPKW